MRNDLNRGTRRGFTLIELMVGVVLFAIIGAALTKLITAQGRFYDRQGMANAARNVSRASLNRVVSDFRMIEATGAIIAASPTLLDIRIPYAIGVECADNNGRSHITLLPVDSTTYAQASFYGYAWRSSTTGAYTYVEGGGTSLQDGVAAVCTGVSITSVPGGKVVAVQPTLPVAAGLGTPTFLYERVQYELKASVAVPGKIGLWRTLIRANGNQVEELVAPFASTAKWRFFTANGGAVAQDNAPADLKTIRGLELHLDGLSEYAVAGQASSESAPFTTAVFFKNRTN
jgi:prepilin-type N-terminal cleavage/methylation domain-containing protein